jgi:hypothetical protein
MAGWDGAGNFVRNYSWVSDAAAGIKILATRMDTEFNTYATGLMNCLTRDGQNSPSANINWGAHKITNLASGTVTGDAVHYGQLVNSQITTCVHASSNRTAQSGLADGVATKININVTENMDVLNEYNLATSVFTANLTGNYRIHATAEFSSNVDSSFELRPYKNGTLFGALVSQVQPTVPANTHVVVHATWNVPLSAGDTFELYGWEDSPGSATWAIGGNANAAISINRII